MSNPKENQSPDVDSHDAVVKLVSQAKHRPLPRSTKALALFVMVMMIFTGGLVYGKHKATASTGTGLSLTGLTSGGGGFGGGGFGGFGGGGRGGNGGGTGTTGTGTGTSGGTGTATAVAADVAGTIVSVTPTTVVIQTLAGDKQTFPILTNTRVRQSTSSTLARVKAGDIVTIKPDSTNAATTITVVK